MLTVLEGRYHLQRLLGTGTTTEVWLAHDGLLRRPVAVKLPRAGHPDAAGRLLAEGRAGARLTHPNIAAVYDAGLGIVTNEAGGTTGAGTAVPYLVMELLADPTLAAAPAGAAAGWKHGTRMGAQVAAALAHAHALWIFHGRLTAERIVLTGLGAKVRGFSRLAEDGAYHPGSAAADVWALGALLREYVPAGTGAPPALDRLIDRCLHTDPAVRPGIDEAALALAAIADVHVELPPHLAGSVPLRRPAPDVDLELPPLAATAQATSGRGTQRWMFRTMTAGLVAGGLSLIAVAALGQVGPGLPWLDHPVQSANAYPPDLPCDTGDGSGCLPSHRPASTQASVPPTASATPAPPSPSPSRPPSPSPSSSPSASRSVPPMPSTSRSPSASRPAPTGRPSGAGLGGPAVTA